MRRTFWFVVGAGTGIYAVGRLRRAAERLGPSALAESVAVAGAGLREFGRQVRVGMVEREALLHERLGLDDVRRGPRRPRRGGTRRRRPPRAPQHLRSAG